MLRVDIQRGGDWRVGKSYSVRVVARYQLQTGIAVVRGVRQRGMQGGGSARRGVDGINGKRILSMWLFICVRSREPRGSRRGNVPLVYFDFSGCCSCAGLEGEDPIEYTGSRRQDGVCPFEMVVSEQLETVSPKVPLARDDHDEADDRHVAHDEQKKEQDLL